MPAIDLQAPTPAIADRAIDALYLHVPFCFHKCHYCDFYSLVDSPAEPGEADRQERFTDRLIDEIRWAVAAHNPQPTTLFVGGGTPTLLRRALWDRLRGAFIESGLTDTLSEFTVEANPETVTLDVAQGLRTAGVDRVSLGAQSFDPDLLKALERWHDPDSVGKAVALLRQATITNINLDLIFAIPGQTLDMLDADLDAALSLKPTHLSCYSLIFEPNTPLTQRMKMGQVEPVDESLEREMYEHVIKRLDAAGYEHYEVSNWAKRVDADGEPSDAGLTDFRCQHNLAYWLNHNWLGLGPSAASHINGKRWKNEPHLGRYLGSTGQPPTTDQEELDADAQVGEQLMLRLRLIEGAPIDWLNALLALDSRRTAIMDELIDQGLLERTATHTRLTRDGLFVADGVIAKLL